MQILEAGKKAKKQKKMSSEQQAGHVAVGQSVGGACPCIHFDFSHDTIVKYWPDTITRYAIPMQYQGCISVEHLKSGRCPLQHLQGDFPAQLHNVAFMAVPRGKLPSSTY